MTRGAGTRLAAISLLLLTLLFVLLAVAVQRSGPTGSDAGQAGPADLSVVLVVLAGVTTVLAVRSFELLLVLEQGGRRRPADVGRVELPRLPLAAPEAGATDAAPSQWRELPLGGPWDLTLRDTFVLDRALALAKLRIELERELRRIAAESRLTPPNRVMGAGELLRLLTEASVLDDQALVAAVGEVLRVANAALHGATVSEEAASRVIAVGSSLVALLEATHGKGADPAEQPASDRGTPGDEAAER
jgi:hypothetical protein